MNCRQYIIRLPLQFTDNHNHEFHWGTYRPQVYFGMRTRDPLPVTTGIMWSSVADLRDLERLRHTCEERDGMARYGWTEHDGRAGGVQVIDDTGNGVRLTTSFVKQVGEAGEAGKGGSWAMRVSGRAARLSYCSFPRCSLLVVCVLSSCVGGGSALL